MNILSDYYLNDVIYFYFETLRYNALVDLLAKYEDEVQKLEKENKDFRLSVTDVDYTSINITKQESGTYTYIEYRRIVDEKDYFEGLRASSSNFDSLSTTKFDFLLI